MGKRSSPVKTRRRNTTLVWAALAPAIRLPALRRDKPMHPERAGLALGLSATADLGAQLKGDAVTHRTPESFRC